METATRKGIVRALRLGQEDHGEDYEKAAQETTLEPFHSLASSSLNVILEDVDDDALVSTRRGIIKTQTCSDLTALQTSTERESTTSSLSSQDGMEDDDDEWGYFSDPLPERPATPVRNPPTNFHHLYSTKQGKLQFAGN